MPHHKRSQFLTYFALFYDFFAVGGLGLWHAFNQSAELARWLAPLDEFAPAILLRQPQNKSQAGLN